jgi:hypothetical protein
MDNIPDIAVSVNDLNANLCRAVGLDPNTVQGFTLTIMGGDIPTLTVYPLPPTDGAMQLTDPWSDPLTDAMQGVSTILLPGADPTAVGPQEREVIPWAPETLPEDERALVACAELMHLLTDVVNGAYINPADRNAVTLRARSLADRLAHTVTTAVMARALPATLPEAPA